jgi:hypothetical protein
VNYFWEVQRARIKAAELARFVAFERTVRSDLNAILGEAQTRYQDLDGSTKTGTLGKSYRNELTLQARMEDADAPLHRVNMAQIAAQAGASGAVGVGLSALGGTPEQMARGMGLDTRRGAVQSEVEVRLVNNIIPREIALFTTGFDDQRLDLVFRERFFVYHDTWRAWGPGDSPTRTYERVEELTRQRVRPLLYAGAADSGVLSAINGALQVLRLDSPFSDAYIRDSIRVRPVEEPGRPTVTATRMMPGDVLEAAYWVNDTSWCMGSCEPQDIQTKRGLRHGNGYGDNFPLRAYRCRGPFFQGATQSGLPEVDYVKLGTAGYFDTSGDACTGPQTTESPD